MNLAIRGFSADLGKEPDDTFARDQFPDLKFDHIMANPPFNISDWGGEKYESDPRWQFGRPPVGNANYAWLQHILWKLRPGGRAGVVLATGALNSNVGEERQIRKSMVLNGKVEMIISLPGQIFPNSPTTRVSIWILGNQKSPTKKVLFIDARRLGMMVSRVLRVLTENDIAAIQSTVTKWRENNGYEDTPGFSRCVSLNVIEENGFDLVPGRYIESLSNDDVQVNFEERLHTLGAELFSLRDRVSSLDESIGRNLKKIGF